ncbi:MAG TPA: lipoyl(octanoyl) transferase LipB [Bryobacteraceae bacterium]|jgi:lipoyl(octanoyl) transferase
MMPRRPCEVRDLGRLGWAEAFEIQQQLVEERKAGRIPDQLLFVEHSHVITLGRNAHLSNILANPEMLSRAGIEVHETNRGGDVTYHGPGQVVGYPIFDLREWKRDVRAYVNAIVTAIAATLDEHGIKAVPDPSAIGVWVNGKKIAAIGVHISRWVTSHGFALNVDTDLSYFRHIVPCGLSKPVTSMKNEGAASATRGQVITRLTYHLGEVFNLDIRPASSSHSRDNEMVLNQTEKI